LEIKIKEVELANSGIKEGGEIDSEIKKDAV